MEDKYLVSVRKILYPVHSVSMQKHHPHNARVAEQKLHNECIEVYGLEVDSATVG